MLLLLAVSGVTPPGADAAFHLPKIKRKARVRPAAPDYTGYAIARIHIIRRKIFDTSVPSENRPVYRGVNRLHVSTREDAIRGQLLFREGDAFNPALARESERALRRILRLRDVTVTPVPVGGRRVDVMVQAQDTWSTEPILSASGTGNDLKYRFGLRERNVLGLGKDLNFLYRRDPDRVSRAIKYADPSFLGSRFRLNGTYEDTSEGRVRALALERPFYSSLTPFSVRASGTYERSETPLYQNGEEVNRVGQEAREFFVGPGFSLGSTTTRVRRLGLEYGYRHKRTFTTQPTRVLTEDKVYHTVGPTLEWSRLNFETLDHIRLYDREEDVNMGPSLELNVGVARSRWFRESTDAVFVTGTTGRGTLVGPNGYVLATLTGEGRHEERWRSARTDLTLEYYDHFHPRHTLAARVTWRQILRPDVDEQLLLGGDTGLRGYPVNEFAGNRVLIANVEDRLFFFPDILKLVGVGGVAFLDAGHAWEQGRAVGVNDIRANVGVGLRFHISRSSLGHVLRLDAAAPVNPREGEKSWLLTFGTDQAF